MWNRAEDDNYRFVGDLGQALRILGALQQTKGWRGVQHYDRVRPFCFAERR
jgi:hypothetical protein